MSENLTGKHQNGNSQAGPIGPIPGKNGPSEPSTGATGPSAPGGSGNGPANPKTKVVRPKKVRLNPRVWRRSAIPSIFTERIPAARLAFIQLEMNGQTQERGDLLFREYGPGNTRDIIDRPYERFLAYEVLLEDLKNDDDEKYKIIHKGTPFYFLAWTAFLMGDYEKSVFYMDAAISEDKKNLPDDWKKYPAGKSLTLSDVAYQLAKIITQELTEQLNTQFDRFNKIPERRNKKKLTIKKLVNKFVMPLMENPEARSIITAFYSFISEYNDRLTMNRLRSEHGGSIEPFLMHLFKGGLIFESLIRLENPNVTIAKKRKRVKPSTIGEFFYSGRFNKKYALKDIDKDRNKSLRTLKEILTYCKNQSGPTKAFITVNKLRNFTGHTLARTDEFRDPEDYSHLYHQAVNALFYVIAKKLKL